jgi:3-methylfumaryl-CoA hydratase
VSAAGSALTLEDAGFASHAVSTISAEHAARIAATIDCDPHVLADGRLPALWHWCYFTPAAATHALGPDGHPTRRPELDAFPRRMWGASKVVHHQPLDLDAPAERTSELAASELKSGSSGTFWVLTVRHRIAQAQQTRIEEDQSIILRPALAIPAPGADRDEPPDDVWVEECHTDPRLLFRFSALTFNTHRIHYDLPYCTGVEGYADLVVHGPLLATLLLDLLRRRTGREAQLVEFRAQAPTLANRRFWTVGHLEGDRASLRVVRGDHAVTVSMRAELRGR